jgi:hypothetical protein
VKAVVHTVVTATLLLLPAAAHAQNRYAFDGLNGSSAPFDAKARLYWSTGGPSNYNNSSGRGSYLSTGVAPASLSPVTGIVGGVESRGFFLFDFSIIGSRLAADFTSATLNVYICFAVDPTCGTDGFISTNPAETIDVWDVTSSTSAMVAGTGGLAAFNDLGSGTKWGSGVVSSSDKGSEISISLNSAGLAALTTTFRSNGTFALGTALGPLPGAITPPPGPPAPTPDPSPSSTVPEPSTWAMLATGLALIGWRARRTQQPRVS